MMLKFAQVIDALEGFSLSLPPEGIGSFGPYSGIELFTGQETCPGVLHIAEGYVPDGGDPASFLVVSETGPIPDSCLGVWGTTAAAVANALARYAMRFSLCCDAMRERLYEHRDVQGFCQAIADFAGNPVIAYDAALLPCGQTAFPGDVAARLFSSGKADRDFVLQTIPDWKREAGKDVFARTGAHRIEDAAHLSQTAACNVISHEGFQGYLEIFEVQKAITDGDMALLEEAAKIAEFAPFPFGEGSLALSHLQGRPISGDLTASWLSALHWNADDGIYVIAVDVPHDRLDDKLYIDHVIRMTRLVVPYSVSQQMGEMPVLVANDRLARRDAAARDVAAFLAKLGDGAHVGASEVIQGVSRLHEGFVHAQFAARNGHERATAGKRAGYTLFEECRFAFFANLCNLEENASLIVDPRVVRMHADDMRTSSDNTLTVRTYIETGFNLNETALRLSVHRNTVTYRLKQVADRYGIDLASPVGDQELLFQVLLSCKLLMAPLA